jgi:hypothetical protein
MGMSLTRTHEACRNVRSSIAGTLEQVINVPDSPRNWNGDEYIVFSPGLNSDGEAEATMKRLPRALSEPISIGRTKIEQGGRPDIAVRDPSSTQVGDVDQPASDALHGATRKSKGDFFLFRATVPHQLIPRQELDDELDSGFSGVEVITACGKEESTHDCATLDVIVNLPKRHFGDLDIPSIVVDVLDGSNQTLGRCVHQINESTVVVDPTQKQRLSEVVRWLADGSALRHSTTELSSRSYSSFLKIFMRLPEEDSHIDPLRDGIISLSTHLKKTTSNEGSTFGLGHRPGAEVPATNASPASKEAPATWEGWLLEKVSASDWLTFETKVAPRLPWRMLLLVLCPYVGFGVVCFAIPFTISTGRSPTDFAAWSKVKYSLKNRTSARYCARSRLWVARPSLRQNRGGRRCLISNGTIVPDNTQLPNRPPSLWADPGFTLENRDPGTAQDGTHRSINQKKPEAVKNHKNKFFKTMSERTLKYSKYEINAVKFGATRDVSVLGAR